jgi:peroxiredoxin
LILLNVKTSAKVEYFDKMNNNLQFFNSKATNYSVFIPIFASEIENCVKIMKKFLSLVVFFLLGTALYAQLPSVKLKTLEGKTIDTAKLSNDGKPFIISFFATWCKPCNRELNAIHENYVDWQDETGVKVIAVSIDQAHQINKVKPLVDGNGWEYDVLLDPNGDFKRALGVNMIPHVFIIDGKGKIVDQRSGYTEGAEEHLIEKVRELTAKK